jgi:hypothetical protein
MHVYAIKETKRILNSAEWYAKVAKRLAEKIDSKQNVAMEFVEP